MYGISDPLFAFLCPVWVFDEASVSSERPCLTAVEYLLDFGCSVILVTGRSTPQYACPVRLYVCLVLQTSTT